MKEKTEVNETVTKEERGMYLVLAVVVLAVGLFAFSILSNDITLSNTWLGMILGIMLVLWCVLIGWYQNCKSRNIIPIISVSAVAVIFLYLLLEMYLQDLSQFVLIFAGVIGTVVIFLEYGILDYAFNTIRERSAKKLVRDVKEDINKEDINKGKLSDEIRMQTAEQLELIEFDIIDTEDLSKYSNIVSRCKAFEERGNHRLALRLYEDCIRNSNDDIILLEAEEGVIRCREQLAG
ncbi:MAG: hypothetical protein ACK5LL_01100 [Suipraeoptans sp.]